MLQDLGFRTGDKVVAINGEPIQYHSEIGSNIIGTESITYSRNGEEKTVELPEDFLGKLTDLQDRSLFELRIPFMIGEVSDSSLNKKVDLKQGDIITAIEGQEVKYFDQVSSIMEPFSGRTLNVTLLRDNETLSRELQVDENGKFGIRPGFSEERFTELGYFSNTTKEYSFIESIGAGGSRFIREVGKYGDQLKAIFNPSTGAYKGVGGFKAIYNIFPSIWSWQAFWLLTAFLSIMLGVLNLLPIPALDGGHVMFLLYEIVSGKAPSEKFMERAQMIGFFILIALVLFANINDWI